MEVTPVLRPTRVDMANMPLERLAASTQVTESEKVGQACRAFEAMLLRQILAESQKPVFASKFVDNSTTAGIYRDMIVTQMAESISRSGDFGLAQTLSGEMQRQTRDPAKAATSAPVSEAEPTPSKS